MRLVSYLAPGYPAALFEALGEVIGAEVGFEVGRSGPEPHADPFASGDADLGWVCSTSFIELTTDREPSVDLVGVTWVPDDPDANGEAVYFSDLVVRPDSPVRRIADLRGRRIGCNDPASLSGYHALRLELAARGDDPDAFAELILTGGHHHSIDQLLAGEVDAAVIDSIVRTRRARTWPEVDALRIVRRLGPWPTQPLVIRSSASTDDARLLRKLLLDANDHPDVRDVFAASAIDRLVAVAPDRYSGVRSSMAELGPTP